MAQAAKAGDQRRWRAAIPLLLSVLTLATIAWAAREVSWREVVQTLDPGALGLAVLVLAALPVLEAVRVGVLAGRPLNEVPAMLGFNGTAAVLAQAPLGLVGAELYKGHAYHRRGLALAPIITAIALARVLGLLALALIAGVLAVSGPGVLPARFGVALAVAGAAGLILLPVLGRFAARILPTHKGGKLSQLLAALSGLSLGALVQGGLISAAIVFVRAFGLVLAAAGLGWSLDIITAVTATALSLLLSLIPFVSSVIGVREGGIAGILALAGIALAPGFAIGLVFRFAALGGGLLVMGLGRALDRDHTQ
jgi:uncharacterized membrane protein YbhN (UPF0104 family)